jgi:two-component system NtrC family sensor kinase
VSDAPPDPRLHQHWTALFDALDGLDCGLVISADRPGSFERLFTSRSAAALLGVPAAEAHEMSMLDPVDESERPRVEAMRDHILAGGSAPSAFETVLKRPDGARVPVEIHAARAPIAGGFLTVSMIQDVGDRHARQGHMLEAERMAIIGAIAAGVAHEINNPLTYVLLHLRSLRRALPRWKLEAQTADDADRLMAEAEGGAERVRVIVRDLMALARGHADADGSIDVDQVVEGAVRIIAPSMQHRARVVRERAAVPAVAGDETRLAHAVLSMLLFAGAGFTSDDPSKNSIEVKVSSEGDLVYVEVSDNGEDLAPERLARAFEPFYAPRGGGPAAGLAVAHGVAVGLGGDATVTRRDGGGAVMRLVLPAQRRTTR